MYKFNFSFLNMKFTELCGVSRNRHPCYATMQVGYLDNAKECVEKSPKVSAARAQHPAHAAEADSQDLKQLEIKGKFRVGGNPGHLLFAIREVGWDDDPPFSSNSHTLDTDVPTFDDLARPNLEFERRSLLVCFE